MDLKAFFDVIEDDSDFIGVDISINETDESGGPTLTVYHVPSCMLTRFPADAVEETDWDTIKSVLVGDREPQAIYHMTRVCGYYSRVENWNPSKVGERLDRNKGNYLV